MQLIMLCVCSGYMAPEYAMHGYLTDKADVYSFGIVALEIISGRSNMIQRHKETSFHLLDWVSTSMKCSTKMLFSFKNHNFHSCHIISNLTVESSL